MHAPDARGVSRQAQDDRATPPLRSPRDGLIPRRTPPCRAAIRRSCRALVAIGLFTTLLACGEVQLTFIAEGDARDAGDGDASDDAATEASDVEAGSSDGASEPFDGAPDEGGADAGTRGQGDGGDGAPDGAGDDASPEAD